jgi:xylulokinase
MSGEFILGIDIGTTGTKILLVNTSGQIAAEVNKTATLISPLAGLAEEDPLEWWRNVCDGVPECLQKAAIDPAQVLAVGVSGMVPTTILVGAQGNPLRRSIQQNDARSVAENDVFERTGSAITQQSIGPKLLWLKKYEPVAFQQARWVMGSYDYINFLLTGEPTLEQNWALESGLYDIHLKDWDDSLLQISGITRGHLPPVHAPSDIVGRITPEAGRQTGLRVGTPVVAGSADHVASAFSVGVKQNGDLLIKLGGAGDILYSLDRLSIHKALFLDYHVIPGLYLINGCMASSGSIIKWYRDNFGAGLDYPALDEEAWNIPAGSDGLILLPYFIGEKTPIFNPLARGVFFGMTLQHTRAHLYHAILEGISFGFQHHLHVLKEAGFAINRVRVANGGARSRLWRQVTSDVIGYPLEEVANHPGSSLGAAFIAGMGVGCFKGWEEIEKFIHLKEPTYPDMEKHAKYQQLYSLYRELYEINRPNFTTLAKIEGFS